MKAINVVCVLLVLFSAHCGDGSNPCPEGYVLNGSNECVPAQDCWSDSDCPAENACLDGKCVWRPECERNDDCDLGQMCQNYTCQQYVTLDPQYETACTSDEYDKAACGIYTVCLNGKCIDACLEEREFLKQLRTSLCQDWESAQAKSCVWCTCHYSGGIFIDDSCITKTYPTCTAEEAIRAKANLGNGYDSLYGSIGRSIDSECSE